MTALDRFDKLFLGKWVNDRSDKASRDAYMKSMDATDEEKKFVESMKPEMTFTRDGDTITWHSVPNPEMELKFDIKFKFGEPFDFKYEQYSNKVVVKMDGDTLVEDVTPHEGSKGRAHTVKWEIVNGEMKETATHKGVSATRYYKRA